MHGQFWFGQVDIFVAQNPNGTSDTEQALTVPAGLVTALVTEEAGMALVV